MRATAKQVQVLQAPLNRLWAISFLPPSGGAEANSIPYSFLKLVQSARSLPQLLHDFKAQ
jgi:hypothetical protein